MNRASRASRHCSGTRTGGFSLLEMLLALLVFGLVASAAYGVLDSITSAASAQEQAGRRLGEVQLALVRLERELRQTVSAGLFNDEGGAPGLQGDAGTLEFSFLATGLMESDRALRRIHYRHAGRSLFRLPATAAATGNADDDFVLLRGVLELRFNYLDGSGNWRTAWDPGAPGDLPAAVRLELELEQIGVLERLFEMPGDRP